MPKLIPDHLTTHLGFVADYFAEIFHNNLRPLNYTYQYEEFFKFGSASKRDEKSAKKTISGLMKLIHPDGKCSKEEMAEYVAFGLEMRRRVREQLKRINPLEFSKVNLSYIDKETGEEFYAECKELGVSKLIPETPLSPGDIFTIGWDNGLGRVALFRIQVAGTTGSGKLKLVGISSKSIKDSAQMAHNYLKVNSRKLGLEHDIDSYDLSIQVMSPGHGTDSPDLGVAFFTSMLSAIVNKPLAGGWLSWAR